MKPKFIQVLNFIDDYYSTLKSYEQQDAYNESTVETAFKQLLINIGKIENLTLIKEKISLKNKKYIIPDGILRDEFKLTRGLWEAKDSKDDLNVEIAKKIEKGYPLKNIIFEDTQRIVLYQNNKVVFNEDMTNRDNLFKVLAEFFTYSEPDIDDFYRAVEIFKENIPKLGIALHEKIQEVKKKDREFRDAVQNFIRIKANMSNKEITEDEVEDMLTCLSNKLVSRYDLY